MELSEKVIAGVVGALFGVSVTGAVTFFGLKTELAVIKTLLTNHIEHRLASLEHLVERILLGHDKKNETNS